MPKEKEVCILLVDVCDGGGKESVEWPPVYNVLQEYVAGKLIANMGGPNSDKVMVSTGSEIGVVFMGTAASRNSLYKGDGDGYENLQVLSLSDISSLGDAEAPPPPPAGENGIGVSSLYSSCFRGRAEFIFS